ncbi:membrane protein [Mycolicibacter kumamotonensis]|uniref:Membrane protein n=2 Tax=Mycolicibacter kumamotonensis TaxID=354243 RepID=A0A1B8SGN2_9MYCO|nr:membrane protein [Mycolicibacter kumamotonensis]
MRLPRFTSWKPLLLRLVRGEGVAAPGSMIGRLLRWARTGVLIMVAVVTLQSVLLVAGAWRNDIAIERDMGVAEAEVLNAGFRRSTIEFVTPERITYRPELGVLYPSELATGMRIYVEYDKSDPDLVRVQHRTAILAIIPAGSIVVIAWLVGTAALAGLAVVERRWVRG